MKARSFLVAVILIVGLVPVSVQASTPAQGPLLQGGSEQEFVVVYAEGVSPEAAHAAITAAGGRIVKENDRVGVATVRTNNPNFATLARQQVALFGVARNRQIGQAPPDSRPSRDDIERLTQERLDHKGQAAPAGKSARPGVKSAEPLAALQWDMAMIHATVDGSYRKSIGDKRVLVGVIDTGIDGSHPDIAPNFNQQLSRNFTTDIPLIDGPCEYPSCVDPANEDDDGHGTHVAGTIAAALNGLGIAGVAPGVTLVNIRAGQDSGYFFLQPTVDALTYAGDIGVDVVNMSYYTDPWLYNCPNNPADSPEAQQEQRTIIVATQRAVAYARLHGVTLIAALGNEHTDLGNPTFDDTSPDYPPGAAYSRTVDNTCVDVPAETLGVTSVSAVGPSNRKAYYSNYGVEQTDVSAPGGDYYDLYGTPAYRTAGNLVLAPYPESLAIANGDLNPDGTPNNPFVIQDCQKGVCAYYQYLQGTSMAAPHAVGVAALIVSKYGVKDFRHPGGLTLPPIVTELLLRRTATNTPCPDPRSFVYPGIPASYTANCEGTAKSNGFYGAGVVDALGAVSRQFGSDLVSGGNTP
jgi:lantibiotic leader peptide-processing serine protease